MSHKWFHRIRWAIMIGVFLFLVYGIRLCGSWISSFSLPIFACEANTDQSITSYCYYLSHLPQLFQYEGATQIIVFFITLILFAIIFGRLFCGFICPMGMFQDLAWKIREIMHIDGINRKEKFVMVLKNVRYIVLFVFVGIAFLNFDFCSICPANFNSMAFAGFTQAINVGFVFGAILIALSFFMRRFWCNICPLGYIVGLFHKFSLIRLEKDHTACTKCGACYEACPMRIKSIYTESEKKDVTTTECIFCGECIKKCPEDNALAIKIGPQKIYISSRKGFEKEQLSIVNGCNKRCIAKEKSHYEK